MVGHDVAVAGELVVAVASPAICCARVAPVGPCRRRASRGRRRSAAISVSRGMTDRPVSSSWSTSARAKASASIAAQQLRRVHRLAVMADLRRPARPARRPAPAGRGDHRPAVDEDLRADLLGHGLAVQRRSSRDAAPATPRLQAADTRCARSSCRCRPTTGSSAPRRCSSARPCRSARRSDRADSRSRLERAEEGEGAGDVVVGDDQRLVASAASVRT